MNKYTLVKLVLLESLLFAIAGCGGGGASSLSNNSNQAPAVVSLLSFPLKEGLRVLTEFSATANFTISGSCYGSATKSSVDAVSSSFENTPSFAISSTETYNFTTCTPSTFSASGVSYFDTDFLPLGSIRDDGQYGVYLSAPVIPISVKVGDSGPISTEQLYTDSTKSVQDGRSELSYVVEADSADSAIVDFVNKVYATSNALLQTSHSRYKITASGAMSPVSHDIHQAPSFSLHLTPLSDTKAPSLLRTSPSGPYAGPAIPISAEFDETLDCSYVPAEVITIVASSGAPVLGRLSCRGRTVTFVPDVPLTNGERYAGNLLSNGIKDLSGNISASYSPLDFIWDSAAPTVTATSPANLKNDVPITSNISITFSEYIQIPSGVSGLSISSASGVVSGVETFDRSTNKLSFIPDAPLQPGTVYSVTLNGQVTDYLLNPIGPDYTWSFTTDPTFRDKIVTSIGAAPSSVAIGDVNGDGKADLLVATGGSANPANAYKLFVYLQNAGGGLNSPVKYATSASFNKVIQSIKIGDINNDGRNDVVTARNTSGMEVYLQNVAGTLDPAVLYSNNASTIDLADLNNDGLLDVVQYFGVNVMLQNLNGTLGLSTVYPHPQNNWGGSGGIGDLNADNMPDIAALVGSSNEFCVLPQSGAGAFSLSACYSTGVAFTALSDLSIGDVNGDSLADVAVVYGGNAPTSKLGIFYQNAGVLQPVINYNSLDIPTQVEIADMTGDGLMDVVVLHDGWDRIGIYRQLANGGGLQAEKLYMLPIYSANSQMTVDDLNGDGKADVVVVDINNGLTIYYHY
ncbi:MAG: VCBS repeat-containing protein [Gammaproteobacteria bacterium]|nr:VCBS repeat-containing protein [Gammaproteobacteria bacterium]MBU1447848.1 VCBS repeat-containing protein [Gammaproteobacteria bacterium]